MKHCNRFAMVVCAVLSLAVGINAGAQDNTRPTIRFSKRQLFVHPHEGCAVADLNRDGHQDIVSSPYIFYGPDFVPQAFRANHLSTDYISANSDMVHDVDRDGLPDIIIGAWGEEGMLWYKNPGNPPPLRGKTWGTQLHWQEATLATTRGKMEIYALHDYDGDGVPEVHTCCYVASAPLEVWRFATTADGTPSLEPFVLGRQGGGHGVAWGDVNGDGRDDVLSEIGWYERPPGDPFAGPWTLHPETDLRQWHPSCPFAAKDLNDDGRLDILFGRAHDYGLYWWEQLEPEADGTTRWKHHVIDESWSQVHTLALADLDDDGVEELITGKCIWAHNGNDPGAEEPPALYYYTWDRETSSFARQTIAGPGEGIALGRQIAVDDLNGDGRPDIVAPAENGLWILINEGNKRVGSKE